MKTSNNGIAFIKSFESLSLKAYVCPAGVVTIGWGHTLNVKLGDVCTVAEADKWLKEDLKTSEVAVNAMGISLSQAQFDALVSFTFNCGVSAFEKSTLRKKVMSNSKDESIRHEFKKWKFANGKVLKGLARRRQMETEMYFRA